jgi:lipopolysaccharide transport system ATP-binding protein
VISRAAADPDEIVTALDVGKRYRHHEGPGDRLRELLGRTRDGGRDFWALRNVTLRVARGESWGVIGLNGAGKSTLLKLVAGVTTPTEGTLAVRERVGALLELGAGFHPEYSGRDNAYLAAAMLGLPGRELREHLRAIEEFADLGEAFERPVRTYSSGMFMRLAFSVATAVEPTILVADEVLAVGDEPFQRRCIRRVESFLAGGGTLLFCSHSMYHVRKLCRRALWLDHGRARASGATAEVVEAYENHLRALEASGEESGARRPDAGFQSRVVAGTLARGSGPSGSAFHMGETLAVTIEVETAPGDDEVPVVAVGCVRNDGTAVYGVFSDTDGVEPVRVAPRRFRITYELLELELLPGEYTLRLHVLDASALRMFDTLELPFAVRGETRELGVCRLRHRWSSA